jgi:ABC-type lipoprotein release transport system permease subunit
VLSLNIALRYLLAKKSHSAVNIISGISVAGVAVATAAIVIVLSVFNGFTDLAASHYDQSAAAG